MRAMSAPRGQKARQKLRDIQARPSAWDLTPNASDPTGTHIDFYHMPPGRWTLWVTSNTTG